jgi:hypothetical protein
MFKTFFGIPVVSDCFVVVVRILSSSRVYYYYLHHMGLLGAEMMLEIENQFAGQID